MSDALHASQPDLPHGMAHDVPHARSVERLRRRYPVAPLVGVAAAVFNAQGQVLMVKRGQPPRMGEWGLPGGLLDVGERLVEGAKREVWEECRVDADIQSVIGTFEPIHLDEAGRVEYHYVVIDFWAIYRSGEPRAQDDAADVCWIDVAELASLQVQPDTRQVIEDAHHAWQAGIAALT